MTKHTAILWEMGEETTSSTSIDGPHGQVAVAYDHMMGSRATARLIASAPELLMTLVRAQQRFLTLRKYQDSDHAIEHCNDGIEFIEAAIAKATGEPTPSP